jgi:hypothetical protein
MWPRFLLEEEMIETPATVFKTHKERGEWAELCFMAKAAGKGIHVLHPYGDSLGYDVGVECANRILRVQVKSTLYQRPGCKYYSLHLHGHKRELYAEGTVDFFAAYLIPIDAWYILPFEKIAKCLSLHLAPHRHDERHAKYREAWHLLKPEPTPSSQVLS